MRIQSTKAMPLRTGKRRELRAPPRPALLRRSSVRPVRHRQLGEPAREKFLRPIRRSPQLPKTAPNTVASSDPAPIYVAHAGERIVVPAILLDTESLPESPSGPQGRLHVTARDPHWLYVYWDLTREQQTALNRQSTHGHLVVRIHTGSLAGEVVGESHVHPQSRHWFAHVENPGGSYFAELGLYAGQQWQCVATAGPVTAPPLRVSPDTSATYVTIHPDRPLPVPTETAPPMAGSLAAEVTAESDDGFPGFTANWSEDQRRAALCALGVIRLGENVGFSYVPIACYGRETSAAWLEAGENSGTSPGHAFGDRWVETPDSESSVDVPWLSDAETSPA